jgi:hypothetical protein
LILYQIFAHIAHRMHSHFFFFFSYSPMVQ